MKVIANPYDLIWCAGAVYFMGIEGALRAWRKSLRPQGVIAFSEACWWTPKPSARARTFWDAAHPAMTDTAGIEAQITAAGYKSLGQRRLSDAAWEAYYTPLEARIALLRGDADNSLNTALDEAAEEIACWRAHRAEFGYLLHVVTPQ
jgi:SAM-dependent methyltransferase